MSIWSDNLKYVFSGHYMSATALMWASTHNATLREKMTSVVNALYACQKKIGTGYLSAFPTEFFDRFEAVQSVWAPYYTIHKVVCAVTLYSCLIILHITFNLVRMNVF